MKSTITILIIFFSLVECSFAGSMLKKITRVDSRSTVQLYFSFDETPQFADSASDKCVSLIFKQTAAAAGLDYFDPDDKIVKILPHTDGDSLILTLFFRYKPQNYSFTRSKDGKIVFDLLPGNQFSMSYKELADRLKGLTIINRNNGETSNPYLLSPYTDDWSAFFSKYESPVRIDIPVQYTFPPFPLFQFLPSENSDRLQPLSLKMKELAQNNHWAELSSLLFEKLQSNPDIINHKLLALTYCEALARADSFENSLTQLAIFDQKYGEKPVSLLSRYLRTVILAVQGDPYLANVKLKGLEEETDSTHPLAPYLLLSQIETTLASEQYTRMNKLLLRDDIALPEQVEEMRQIRQGDYWYAINQPVKAYVAYSILSDPGQLQNQPLSLNGYCGSLYSGKMFGESAKCYGQLSLLTVSDRNSGLVKYREKMAELKFTGDPSLIYDFSQIESSFPNSEPGFRAGLKKNDLLLLQQTGRQDSIVQRYAEIADQAILRPIKEEALFKQALVLAIRGQISRPIAILQKILREFRKEGQVRDAGYALLIELLPKEIKQLVDNKEYLKALVLAKQNREFFQKGWLDPVYLVDIAKSYQQIGLFGEAQQLYLFLIETVSVDNREHFYLPMIDACLNNGSYSLVEEYAAQYTYNYPQGIYSDEILFLRLQALVADQKFSEAFRLIPDPLPDHDGIFQLAAALSYQTDNFNRSIQLFKILSESGYPFSYTDNFMYGESLFKTGHLVQAEKIYLQINPENPFYSQSRYRLSQIEEKKGEGKNSLRFLREIVDTGRNNLWKRYALDELQYSDTDAELQSISAAIQTVSPGETAEK